jgi:ion channel
MRAAGPRVTVELAVRAGGKTMARQVIRRDPKLGEGSAAVPGRFGLLLILLICAYLMSAFVTGRWVSVVQVVIFTGTALLALRNWHATSRMTRPAVAVVLAVSALSLALQFTTETGAGIASIWTGLILLAAALLIVRRVFAFRTVTVQSIYGVLSVYIILGLMFAAFYAAIGHLGGGHFFANNQPASTQTFQYFSFTTLTTLGYGDFTAASSGSQALAVIEAMLGQVFLATLVARLVSAFGVPRPRGGAGSPRSPGRPRRRPAGGAGLSVAGRDTARGSPGKPGRARRPGRPQPPARDTSLPGHAPPARRSRSRRER